VQDKPVQGELKSIIAAALKNFYLGFDTAAIYDNESIIGAALASIGAPRSSFWLQTKLWRSVRVNEVEKKLRKSLKQLQIDYVDCYIMHWPGPGRGLHFPPVTKTKTTQDAADNTIIISTKSINKNPKVVQVPNDWSSDMRLLQYAAMSKCVDKKLTKHLGVSNFTFVASERIEEYYCYAGEPTRSERRKRVAK